MPTRTPALPEVGLVALVADEWNHRWQPRHQIISRLAQYFHVVWVNPPAHWTRVFDRLGGTRSDPPAAPPGFEAYSAEFWLPKFYGPAWLAKWTDRLRLEKSRDRLRRKGCQKIILYLWRPEFSYAMELLPADLTCYHMDDEYTFSSVEQPVLETERRLIETVGQVFINSQALMEKKSQFNPRTVQLPNGVDFAAFSTPVREPPDIAAIPHPRIGYSGWMKKQLDWDLLLHLAVKRPDWNFVFVGAVNQHEGLASWVSQLSSCRNVWFLGSKTTSEISAYPQHFDVCLMPYREDGYTKYIYPLKVHEYLASGRYTVGTPLPALKEFDGVVALPRSRDEWLAAIETGLGPRANSLEARRSRQQVARSYDWDTLVFRIASVMADRLGLPYSQVLQKLSLSSHAR
jgi:glycosyltransferase involved in cell wall biosynthesis